MSTTDKKINPKTNFVEIVNRYHKVVGVKTKKEFDEKHGCIEHGLGSCIEIFFGQKFQGGKNEKAVKEVKDGKKLGQAFKCDWYANIEGKDIVFEFNGNHHYQSPFKIFADWRKNEVLTNPSRNEFNKKFIVFKVPYYMQLTRDYALYLFQDLAKEKLGKSFYSDEKFKKAIKKIYNTDREDLIYAPGLHTSQQTPATYCEDGIERFLQEMKDMSKYPSIKHQVVKSLKLWEEDVTYANKHPWKNNKQYKNLIIPKNKAFLEFYNFEPDKKYLNCVVYERGERHDLMPKNT